MRCHMPPSSFELLPDLCVELISSFMSPEWIIKISQVSRMTRKFALGSNVLWTRCCRELFKSKYNCPTSRTELPLHANTRLSEEQLKLLSVKQLRSFLRTLGVAQNQINQCVEKGEMRRLCKGKSTSLCPSLHFSSNSNS